MGKGGKQRNTGGLRDLKRIPFIIFCETFPGGFLNGRGFFRREIFQPGFVSNDSRESVRSPVNPTLNLLTINLVTELRLFEFSHFPPPD